MNFALPCLEPAPGRPAWITKARERLEDLLEHKPRKLLELHGAQLLPEWQRRRVVPRRPIFREAIGRVLGAMLEHTDTISYRVGAPRPDGFVVPPGQQGPEGRESEFGLVMETGCSIQRVRRVISTAVRIGWLEGPRKDKNGKMIPSKSGRAYQHVKHWTDAKTGKSGYAAHRVVYVFTDAFFAALGKDMSERMVREREAAVTRRRERRERMYPGPLLAGRELVKGMRHGSRERRPLGAPATPTAAVSVAPAPRQGLSVDAAQNEERLAGAIALGLRNKHPDWPGDRVRAEALALARAKRLS